MRRLRIFLTRFLLSLWIILFSSFLFLLVFEARGGGIDVPFAGVYINAGSDTTIALPNRIFTCTETGQRSECQADIQGQSLVLVLETMTDFGPSQCQAQYNGQSISCLSKGFHYAPITSEAFEVTGLALSPQQLQAVQQKYWGIQTLLTLGESRLINISSGLSLVAGVIAAYFAWRHPHWLTKGLASLVWGLILYQWAWITLASVPYAAVTPYGFTSETWDRVANQGAMVVGIGVTLIAVLLLRQRANRATQTVVTLSSGIGTAWIVSNILLWVLLGSGFAD